MKYRKKPVVVEAIQWTGQNLEAVSAFTCIPQENLGHIGQHVTLQTLEGLMFAAPGDWIIKGVKGEFYPCKPDIFEATYEAV